MTRLCECGAARDGREDDGGGGVSDRAYVLTTGDYSDYSVLAVFTDVTAAIAAAEEHNASGENSFWGKCRVEVFPFNRMEGVSSGWYEVSMPLNGGDDRCYKCPEVPLPGERGPIVRREYGGDKLLMVIEARDCEHALKIAGERKTRLQVTGEIGQIPNEGEDVSA